MKQYLKVQSDRKKYHLNPLKNTVHRSSLLAPTMQGAETLITFINHFNQKKLQICCFKNFSNRPTRKLDR